MNGFWNSSEWHEIERDARLCRSIKARWEGGEKIPGYAAAVSRRASIRLRRMADKAELMAPADFGGEAEDFGVVAA